MKTNQVSTNENNRVNTFLQSVDTESIETLEKLDYENILEFLDYQISNDFNRSDALRIRSFVNKLNKHFEKANEDLSKALKLNPSDIFALFYKGNTYGEMEQENEAEDQYNEVIKMDHKFINGFINRGIMYERMNNIEKAIKDYNKVLELNPKLSYILLKRGILLQQIGEQDNALKDFNEVIQLNQIQEVAYYYRGNLQHAQNQHEAALKDFDYAIQIDSQFCDAYFQRGKILERIGQIENALRDYNQAILIDKKFLLPYLYRANLYLSQGKLSESLEDYNQAIELDPNNIEANYQRALLHCTLNIPHKAIQDFNKVIELNPNQLSAFFHRGLLLNQFKGLLHVEIDELQNALQDFYKVIEIEPKFIDSYIQIADIQIFQEKFDEAIQILNTVIELDPNNGELYSMRGISYSKLQKEDSALENFNLAIKKVNPDFNAYLYRGNLQITEKQYDEAKENFVQALGLDQNQPLFAYYLSSICFKLNDKQSAQKYLNLSQTIFQTFSEINFANKYNIQSEIYDLIKEKIELIEKLDNKIINLNQTFSQAIKENKEYQQFEKEINLLNEKVIQQLIQQENQSQVDSYQFNFKSNEELKDLILEIQNQIEFLQSQQQKINDTNLNSIISQQGSQIEIEKSKVLDNQKFEEEIQNLKEQKNGEKYLYFQSLTSHLLTYFETYILVYNNSIKNKQNLNPEDQDQFKLVIKDVAKKISPLFGKFPIVGNAIKFVLNFIDQEKGQKNNFVAMGASSINNIAQVISSKSQTYEERKIEVQYAALQILNQFQNIDQSVKDSTYYQQVQQIIQIEQKEITEAQNPFWQLGIEHSLIILKFIDKHSQIIINNSQLLLRKVILDAIHENQNKLQQSSIQNSNDQVTIVQPSESRLKKLCSCCEIQ